MSEGSSRAKAGLQSVLGHATPALVFAAADRFPQTQAPQQAQHDQKIVGIGTVVASTVLSTG